MTSGNLPQSLTSFIGRDEELRLIDQLISERRLVTLTGAGGVGKTRLAARAAMLAAERWSDGVWFVDLGPVKDPALLPREIASCLGVLVEPGGDQVRGLAARLQHRRMLLVVDTCEHVLDAAAALVETLLLTCPDITVVATSREPLRLDGETVWGVPPLSAQESVLLFADRASLVAPRFDVSTVATDVQSVCDRVDRIPLAIELAAAWVRAMAPSQIAAGLQDRFRFLGGAGRRGDPRHQTLLASMEWSHGLLPENERTLFRRLGVFAGAFTLDAVAAVCTDPPTEHEPAVTTLQLMGRLLDKSLVTVREGHAEPRYLLLDTIRDYAATQLAATDESESVRDRHLEFFLALAEQGEQGLDSDQDSWRVVLDSHHDDIAAALHWGLAEQGVRADRARLLAAAMARQWFVRGQTVEGLDFLDRAIALDPSDRSAVQARLWSGTAMLAMVSGRRELVATASERGLDIAAEAHDDATRARCLALRAFPYFFVDFPRCQALAAEAQAAGEEAGDPFARDWAAVLEGYSLQTRNRHDDAVAVVRPAFERSQARGDRFCAAFALGVEVFSALVSGEVRRAFAIGEDAVRTARPLGDYFAVGTNTVNAAQAAAMGGRLAEAHRLMDPIVRSLESAPEADVVGFMVPYGFLHLWEGELDDALSWFERGVPTGTDQPMDWTAGRCLPGLVEALRRLGRADEAAQWAARAVVVESDFDASYELSNVLDEQAWLNRETNPDRARDLFHQALTVRMDHGLRTGLADSLDGLATLEADAGAAAAAVRLLAAADVAREEMGYPRPPVERPGHDAVLDSLRAELGEEFESVWDEGRARSLDDAIAVVTRGRGPRGRPPTGWDSLTPTEVDVARLVSDGLSNPDIATRLYMSRSTVKTHLSHVYAKLGVDNRAQLASLTSAQALGS